MGLALQTAAPDAAWWDWCSQEAPASPAHWMWYYQTNPGALGLARGRPWSADYLAPPFGQYGTQFWQYQEIPWSSTRPSAGLFVEQSQSPAGYLIRVRTGQPGTPALDIGVEGGVLMIQSRSMAGASGGASMQMQQVGWATQWVSLAFDADVAAMQVQWGDGIVEIFIPRRR